MQVKPPCSFTQEETEYLTSRIQNGGTEVVEVGGILICNNLNKFIFLIYFFMWTQQSITTGLSASRAFISVRQGMSFETN